MAALLTNQTSDTTGSGTAMTGPCSVLVRGTFDGAKIVLEAADADTEANYTPAGFKSSITSAGWVDVNLQGTYYLRAKQSGSGSSTSLTVIANQ